MFHFSTAILVLLFQRSPAKQEQPQYSFAAPPTQSSIMSRRSGEEEREESAPTGSLLLFQRSRGRRERKKTGWGCGDPQEASHAAGNLQARVSALEMDKIVAGAQIPGRATDHRPPLDFTGKSCGSRHRLKQGLPLCWSKYS